MDSTRHKNLPVCKLKPYARAHILMSLKVVARQHIMAGDCSSVLCESCCWHCWHCCHSYASSSHHRSMRNILGTMRSARHFVVYSAATLQAPPNLPHKGAQSLNVRRCRVRQGQGANSCSNKNSSPTSFLNERYVKNRKLARREPLSLLSKLWLSSRSGTDVTSDLQPDWLGYAKVGFDWLLEEKPELPGLKLFFL